MRPGSTENTLPRARSAQFGRRAVKGTIESSEAKPVLYSEGLRGYTGRLWRRENAGNESAEDNPSLRLYQSGKLRAPTVAMPGKSRLARISDAVAADLRRLVFGGDSHVCPSGWHQGFILADCDVPYCLVQGQGGPCGVLAAVMAYMLKAMREKFPTAPHGGLPHVLGVLKASRGTMPPIIKADRRALLVEAIADILWRIAEASPSHTVHLVCDLRSPERPHNGLMSTLTSKADVISALQCTTLYEEYIRGSSIHRS